MNHDKDEERRGQVGREETGRCGDSEGNIKEDLSGSASARPGEK